jgi:hypothetical protein
MAGEVQAGICYARLLDAPHRFRFNIARSVPELGTNSIAFGSTVLTKMDIPTLEDAAGEKQITTTARSSEMTIANIKRNWLFTFNHNLKIGSIDSSIG